MKLNYINKKALKKASKTGALVLAVGILASSLTGCSREVSTNAEVKYDVIDTMNQDLANSGIEQIVDVPGEDFDIVVDYRCILEENERWTITSDKDLNIEVRTEGLDDNTEVFIDNIHTDTTIKSYYPSVDGITQDTMDDRIHNAQMLGFPISDTNSYSNVIEIEGQNQTFMQGSYYGFNGYGSGNVTEKRYVESDYLERGVYANKIKSAIDLIINKEDGTTKCMTVPSTIVVSVWPYIKNLNRNGQETYNYYYYDEDRGRIEEKKYDEDEYYQIIGKPKQYQKQK